MPDDLVGTSMNPAGQRLNIARRPRTPVTVKVGVAAAGTATLLAAPAAGLKNKVALLVISNTNATAGVIAFKDGAGGTAEFTIGVPASQTIVIPFTGFWTQTTAATLLQIAATGGNYDVLVEYIVE